MKLFTCKKCGQQLYFENTHCECCGSPLGFLADTMELHTLIPHHKDTYKIKGKEGTYRYCSNAQYEVCNWILHEDEEDDLCTACSLNHTIPNLQVEGQQLLWTKMELAKHRLLYSLMRLNLPVRNKEQDAEHGLGFEFLADQGQPVMTGHAQGMITLNIAEADDAERARRRADMGEPYRTLLGHFRHEVGHYYWDRLIQGSKYLSDFRKLFGDEQEDYGKALQRHYQQGTPEDWQESYISEYATAHPWEDWAESWAHYLHLLDTLDTAYAFGLKVNPKTPVKDDSVKASMDSNPYHIKDFEDIISLWLPLTFAMNSLSRSMGQGDTYPFVIPPPVIEKLSFIHKVCQKKH